MKKVRATAFAVAAIAIVTAILFIRTPLRVQGTFVLRLANPEVVYAEVEGRLVELNVKNGQWVTKDTVLATLSNPQKQKELLEKQLDHDVNWHKYLWFDRSPERESRAQAMRHQEMADKAEPIIENITKQIGKLTLVANRDGQVIGAPPRSSVGQWLKPGKPAEAESITGKPSHELRRQAVLLRDRRPPQARGAPDPRPVRHQPLARRQPGLAEGRRQGRGHLQGQGRR